MFKVSHRSAKQLQSKIFLSENTRCGQTQTDRQTDMGIKMVLQPPFGARLTNHIENASK